MTDLAASPLGHATTYSDRYDPALLFAVERGPLRAALGVATPLPFHGEDLWTAYELSWLEPSGKPAVAIATLRVPATSPCIVESKSMKLYLTAFNQTRFASPAAVAATIRADLAAASRAEVEVTLALPEAFAGLRLHEPDGTSLDDLPFAVADVVADPVPSPDALVARGVRVDETLHTRLFRSVCPVTGQPDYATVVIRYQGNALDRHGLLRYLVSYRLQPGFHEHCVEQVFMDLWRRCAPQSLQVYARFTRRGGIDINPYRSSTPLAPAVNARTAQQ
ncbi:MAG: NADPH-dependent 7-cyano-7-deazaguanine reductase QueF [Casimicrobiaceae bacterium]